MVATLVKIRDWLKAIYGKYDIVFVTLFKFLIAFCAMKAINDNIGYYELFQNPFIPLIISLVCSILPSGIMALILALCMLVNIYQVSLEMTIIAAMFLIAIALMYYSFHPGDVLVLILTPVLMVLKIPYLVPLVVGLTGSIISVIPIGCGVVIYYLGAFVKNADFTESEGLSLTEMPGRFIKIIDGILTNKEMWMIAVILGLGVVIVFLIHNFSFPYSWYVAIGVGAVAMIAASVVLKVEVDYVGLILSVLITCVFNLFLFSVDYQKTERLQFQDDDYYYYVKAIPKISADMLGEKESAPGRRKREESNREESGNRIPE